jgi:hypothetical protein
MSSFELTTGEDLIRQHAPELIPQQDLETRIAAQFGAFSLSAMLTYWAVLLTDLSIAPSVTVALTSAIAVTAAFFADRLVVRNHQQHVGQVLGELKDSPWKFYETVASKFASEVERQRARTLGPNSEWGRARRPLESATQEAARSVAYWTQRLSMDPANQLAQQQLTTARQLHDKFREALSELDSRSQTLVSFFNECEARLAVLQHSKRDYEESRRLGALTDRAEDIVAGARKTLASIRSTFLPEATRVGQALGGLEVIGLLNIAADTPIDQVETIADRILESSVRERTALERLAKDMSE